MPRATTLKKGKYKKMVIVKGNHINIPATSKNKVLVSETYITNPPVVSRPQHGIVINVTDKFLKKLSKPPKCYQVSFGNACFFGKKFKKDYIMIAGVVNDGSMMGLLNITNMTYSDISSIRNHTQNPVWYKGKWSDPKVLKKIREEVCDKILFITETHGGDVGMNIYIHLDKNNEIDSLVMDNNTLFNEQ
jgi:hypothetical protein